MSLGCLLAGLLAGLLADLIADLLAGSFVVLLFDLFILILQSINYKHLLNIF